jgi:hypothetical protein
MVAATDAVGVDGAVFVSSLAQLLKPSFAAKP